MKAIPFALLFLSSIVVADTTVYQCEMSVADVKNGALTDVIKAPYGAMVVDSGDQFSMLCVTIEYCHPHISQTVMAN